MHGIRKQELKQLLFVYTLIFTEVIACPSLAPPANGTLTFTPGAHNSNIGLGSVATYSCNLGYVLVGQSTRECLTANGGAWSGNQPTCEGTARRNDIIRIVQCN